MRDAQGATPLDRLRELAADINSTEIIDHTDAVKFMFHTEWFDSWHKAFDAACEEIEREIAERYMELPLDADGVLIRFGDSVCEVDDIIPMKVMSFTYYEDCVDVNACGMNPKLLRHVKPRTIEDVLRDCCNEWNKHAGNDWESSVYAKYAAELRELMGGDA